jgi:hypothetical protein
MRRFALSFLMVFSTTAMADPWVMVDDLQGTIPQAPRVNYDSRNEQLCKGDPRKSIDVTDEALTDAGWLLWDETQRDGDFAIRIVAAGQAGQCRPVGISIIVFAGGLPVAAYQPAATTANLAGELKSGYLHLSQTYPKPGEGLCCGTGKRAMVVRLEP